jgi:hypothetical protein
MYANVLAVIATVFAILVAIALFWWANSGIISSCETCGPVVLSAPERGGEPSNYTVTFMVVHGPQNGFESLTNFKTLMVRDGEPLVARALDLNASGPMRFGSNVTLSFTDTERDGRLTSGDGFLVFGMTGIHEWKFHLISPSGDLLSSVTWVTPYISTTAVQTGGGGTNQTATFSIAEASEHIPLSSNLKVYLSGYGWTLPNSPMTLQAGGIMYFGSNVSLIFTDIGGDGQLSSGDGFLFYGMGSGSWALRLICGPDVLLIHSLSWDTT